MELHVYKYIKTGLLGLALAAGGLAAPGSAAANQQDRPPASGAESLTYRCPPRPTARPRYAEELHLTWVQAGELELSRVDLTRRCGERHYVLFVSGSTTVEELLDALGADVGGALGDVIRSDVLDELIEPERVGFILSGRVVKEYGGLYRATKARGYVAGSRITDKQAEALINRYINRALSQIRPL